jgi:Phage Mu protein F like protein
MLSTAIRKAGAQDAARLSAFQTGSERAIKRVFSYITSTLDSAAVKTQLSLHNYEGAIDELVRPFEAIGDSLVQIYINAAHGFTDEIGRQIGQHVSFNVAQPRVVTDMRTLRAFFVQDLNATMREALRKILLHGLQNSWSFDEMAQGMIGTVGLTARDVAAIENYRQGVIRGDRAALDTPLRDRRYDTMVRNQAVGDQALERMVAAKERLTRQISLGRLTQTEVLRATNMGRNALVQQLIDTQVIDQENVQRTWYAIGDPKTRDTHAAQSGETRGHDEPFTNGLMYPGDPDGPASEVVNCRCWLTFDVQPS